MSKGYQAKKLAKQDEPLEISDLKPVDAGPINWHLDFQTEHLGGKACNVASVNIAATLQEMVRDGVVLSENGGISYYAVPASKLRTIIATRVEEVRA